MNRNVYVLSDSQPDGGRGYISLRAYDDRKSSEVLAIEHLFEPQFVHALKFDTSMQAHAFKRMLIRQNEESFPNDLNYNVVLAIQEHVISIK